MLIIEDGSGVRGANSYNSVAEITQYLTDRNRVTENSWATAATIAQEAAAIAGTDFIENRFGLRFKGIKRWRNIAEARTVLTFTTNPTEAQTVTLDSTVYTFLATPLVDNDVEIGSNTAFSITNLVNAINSNNADVNSFEFFDNSILIAALVAGTAGNDIATTTNVTGATFSFATTRGGNDTGEAQPLSFARASLHSRDGVLIHGIPDKLKQAVSEYAVRALVAVLQNDVVPDASGRIITVTKSKLGPLETTTEFQESAGVQIAAYPAADSLLSEYLNPTGGVMR